MKLRLLFTCFVMVLSPSAFSQTDTVLAKLVWGDRIPLKGGYYKLGFVGDTENGFLQISLKNKRKLGFAQISGNLKYESSNYETIHDPALDMFGNIIQVGRQAFVLYNVYNKKTGVEKLSVRRIDIRQGGVLGNAQELVSTKDRIIETVKYPGTYDYTIANKYTIIVSENGERILLFYRIRQDESKSTDKLVYHLFDRNWKYIWSKDVFMPRPRSDMKIIGHSIVNNRVFMFVRIKSGEVDWNTKQPEFDKVSVVCIDGDEAQQSVEYPLEFDGTNLYDITLSTGKNNQILLVGFFKLSRVRENYVGYFTAVFNPSLPKLENVNLFTFSNDLIMAHEAPEKVAKLNKALSKGEELGLADLKISKVILRDDGGWYLVGEQRYFQVEKDSRSRSIVPIFHYWYMDMLVASVGSDGVEEWIMKVPKKQHFINTTFGAGMSAFGHANDLYLFHMEHKDNRVLNDSIQRTPFVGTEKDLTLMCVKISKYGVIERWPVQGLGELNYMIDPANMEEIKPGLLLLGGKNVFWVRNKPALVYLD